MSTASTIATRLPLALLLALAAACAGVRGNPDIAADAAAASLHPAVTLTPFAAVSFDQLNPARGDQSPLAGTVWGDRSATGATGFLFRPTDGFESPPHIHNVSYRGVVIRGLVHNDDPGAAAMWMPAGSYWTQPRGEAHITAAKGADVLAYIEIESGPYLVHPAEEAFDAGERPLNLEASNVVWLSGADSAWIDATGDSSAADGAGLALLWGSTRPGDRNGTLLRLPAGFEGSIENQGADFRAVVIQGRLRYGAPGAADAVALEPGSSVSATAAVRHQLSAEPASDCVLYVRTDGAYRVRPR